MFSSFRMNDIPSAETPYLVKGWTLSLVDMILSSMKSLSPDSAVNGALPVNAMKRTAANDQVSQAWLYEWGDLERHVSPTGALPNFIRCGTYEFDSPAG